jgi:hypothetical protein
LEKLSSLAFSLFVWNGYEQLQGISSRPFCGLDVTKSIRRWIQGFALDDDANAFFTTAESFDQPQARELSSQCGGFGRSAGCLAAREGMFLGVNTSGGPAG